MEMIILEKSSKYGGYCVAGIDCSSGGWVRLVSEDEETHGALNDEMLFDRSAGRSAGVLDRVQVEIAREVPGAIQPENMLVEGNGKIRIVGRTMLKEALNIHPCEEREKLFGSHSHIVQVKPETLGHSLELVRATELRIYSVTGKSGSSKRKMDFECGGRKYTQFAVTDPVYYGEREVKLPEAALVLSISDDKWSRVNGHYIYAARIFSGAVEWTGQEEKPQIRLKRKGIWKRVIAAAVIAAVLAMIIAVFSMGTSYFAPYSGARRHEDMQCQGLGNANAVRSLPTAIARILFKPCMYCADGSD